MAPISFTLDVKPIFVAANRRCHSGPCDTQIPPLFILETVTSHGYNADGMHRFYESREPDE